MTSSRSEGELVLVGRNKAQLREASRQSITEEQIETFFSELADTCNLVRSAKAAGFSANWAYRKRKMDAGFRAGWARAVAEGYAKRGRALRRGHRGRGGEQWRGHGRKRAPCRGGRVRVKLVHASRGKAARAEPIALRFESGRAFLAGSFPQLEDELAGLTTGGGYEGPGRSPDRADAMVWAMTELSETRSGVPRVRML